ncbi:unnamed protein product, partial [marine sediment metagenome]
RDYLKDAVAAIHLSQAQGTFPLVERDASAYALWGSTYKTPRTWFNQIVKNWLNQKVAGQVPIIFRGTYLVPGDTECEIRGRASPESGDPSGLNVHFGTSKTALIHIQAITQDQFEAGVEITGLTNGLKYYFQVRPTVQIAHQGSWSGIYYSTPVEP